jgi:hypothetical protein
VLHSPGSSADYGGTHTVHLLLVNKHVRYCHNILYRPAFALYRADRRNWYITVRALLVQTRNTYSGKSVWTKFSIALFWKENRKGSRSISTTGTWQLPVHQTDEFVSGSFVHSPCNLVCVLCVMVGQGVESHASWWVTDTQCVKHFVSWRLRLLGFNVFQSDHKVCKCLPQYMKSRHWTH